VCGTPLLLLRAACYGPPRLRLFRVHGDYVIRESPSTTTEDLKARQALTPPGLLLFLLGASRFLMDFLR
jgi:hypothetical protein